MGKIFRPFPVYKFQAKEEGLPKEAGELWQDYIEAEESEPVVRAGCSSVPVLGGVSVGIQ